jgi:hypothetical protein
MANSRAQQEFVQLNLISENETKRVEKNEYTGYSTGSCV